VALAPAIGLPRARAPGESMAGVLTTLAVVSMFLLSGLMLSALGIAYDTSGGALWQKIHPASYFALLAVACLVFLRLDPLTIADDLLRFHKRTLVFLGVWFLLLIHAVVFVHAPAAAIVDTFLLPVLLLFLLPRVSERQVSNLAVFVHAAMTANALIAIFEFAVGARLTPLVAEGVILVADWRSSALLGYPLLNALLTAAYTLIMIQGGGRDLPRPMRVGIVVLQLVALVAFGGRVATLMLMVFAAGLGAASLLRSPKWRITPSQAALAVAAIVGSIVVLVLLAMGGFFDLFALRFQQDLGSSDARVAMFHLIGQLPFFGILFGSDPEHVATLQRLNGIEFGIESFWVAFVTFYGIVIAIPFFAGFVGFLFDLKDATREGAGVAIIFFIIVCSTSLSLAGKTTSLAMFTVMLLVLLRPFAYSPGTSERWSR
jgi:hypothetical protein